MIEPDWALEFDVDPDQDQDVDSATKTIEAALSATIIKRMIKQGMALRVGRIQVLVKFIEDKQSAT